MMRDVGKIIREARERRGWSQEQLAEHVGATQSTIDRIESGVTHRSRYTHEIVKALGLIEYSADIPEFRQTTKETSNLVEKTIKLPADLVERIFNFKVSYDIPSEEEALKQLIDEGLMHYDHFQSVTTRIIRRFREKKSLKEAARYVLGNHPLVQSVTYGEKTVKFVLTDQYKVEINNSGIATVLDENNEFYEFSLGDEPDWAAPENLDPPRTELDD